MLPLSNVQFILAPRVDDAAGELFEQESVFCILLSMFATISL